jgi:hypothetical protein
MPAAKHAVRTFIIAILYACLAYAVQACLCIAGVFEYVPNAQTLTNWDAAWYQSIAEKGYVYWTWGGCNLGFYPFFSLLWRWLHLGIWEVVAMNTVLFAAGFTIVSGLLKANTKQQLLFLSLPPVYFAFIPYTEALSFLLVAGCLYGVVHKKSVWVVLCLFALSLTRVSAIYVAVALLLMELVCNSNERWVASLRKSLLLYLLPVAAGLALFICYQYHVTGIWFVYFQQQSTFWGHTFSWPRFPFTNIEGGNTIVLSALATVFCVAALLYALYTGWRWLRYNIRQQDRLWVLSLAYLSGILLLTMFFNPQWGRSTHAMGIHRYAMCTPFFFMFLQQFSARIAFRSKHCIAAFVLCNLVLVLFGALATVKSLLLFSCCTIIFLLYMLNSKYKWIGWVLIVLMMTAQVFLFQDFLTGGHYPD